MTLREAAIARETARVLRSNGCCAQIARALRIAPLTATELREVFRRRYRPRTVYGWLATLRLLGLAEPTGLWRKCLGGCAEIWRAT